MTEILTQDQPPHSKVCMNCGNPEIVRDVPNALCAECRAKFIKFPIPLWVKIFGGAIAALVIFSFFSFPAQFTTGITFEKGIKAESDKNYVTAQKYFGEVAGKVHGDVEAQAHLLIASFYNNNLYLFAAMADSITGKTVDNDGLLRRVQNLLDVSAKYFPSDSFMEMKKQYPDNTAIPDSAFLKLIKIDSNDIFTRTMYASSLYDRKDYSGADKILTEILNLDKDNISALSMMTGIKRLENKTQESLQYCDALLALNQESIYGLSSKARTLLKLKRNDEALKLAIKSYELDSTDNYSEATLALAYHFNNDLKKRDNIINKAAVSKDSTASVYFEYVLDIIANRDSL